MGADDAASGSSLLPESAEKLWREHVLEPLEGASGALSGTLEAGLAAASGAVLSTTATARQEAGQALATAQSWWASGLASYHSAESKALDSAKEAISYGTEHKEAAGAGGLAAAMLLLPAPRAWLIRKTLGRLRSPEAVLRSAEARTGELAQRLEGQLQEVGKLQERLALAEAEHARGLAKLRATAHELGSLASRVGSTEKAASALIAELRAVPQRQALALRSAAAQAAASAAAQRAVLDKAIVRLAKRGF